MPYCLLFLKNLLNPRKGFINKLKSVFEEDITNTFLLTFLKAPLYCVYQKNF